MKPRAPRPLPEVPWKGRDANLIDPMDRYAWAQWCLDTNYRDDVIMQFRKRPRIWRRYK